MNKSSALLYEGLYELNELAKEATKNNPLLYEGAGYTPFQIIAEETKGKTKDKKKAGFIKRTTAAIEKVKTAAKAGIKELDSLKSSLDGTTPPMSNSSEAVGKAAADLKKQMPGDGFLSKLGALGGGAWNALFGDEDDPIEKVTEIVADGQRFQSMMGNIVNSVLEILGEIEPVAVVDDAAEDAADDTGEGVAVEISPEEKKKYIEEIKTLLLNGSIKDILESDDPSYVAIREATGFSEKNIVDAIKKSVKTDDGWFSGLKSLGGALGIGLGGDLPFKKYGLKLDGLYTDVSEVKISSLKDFSGKVAAGSGDQAVMDNLSSGIKQMDQLDGEHEEMQQQADAQKKQAQKPGAPDAGGEGDQPGDEEAPADQTPDGTDQSKKASYVKILKTVGIDNPDAASEKLAGLLAAGAHTLSLYNILSEKVLRYDDVVSALEEHLPEEEGEIPAVIKKLSDEMKIELGNEFDIVGVPDSNQEDLAALRKEIEALRAVIEKVPEDQRDTAIEDITGTLGSEAGISSDQVEDILDTSIEVDDVVSALPADNLEDVSTAIPSKPEELLGDDVQELIDSPDTGPAEEEEVAPVADLFGGEAGDKKSKKQKREPGSYWALSDDAKEKDKKGRQWAAKGKGQKSKKIQRFKSEEAAEKYSLRTENIALAKMRGFILGKTNNFIKTSKLSKQAVVSEFYRLGGKNEMIINEVQSGFSKSRWSILAGFGDDK